MNKIIPLFGVSFLISSSGCSPQSHSRETLLNTPLAARVAAALPMSDKMPSTLRQKSSKKKLIKKASRVAEKASGVSACLPSETPFGGGHGTARDPYLICSATQWNAMNGKALFFKLASNISFEGEQVSTIESFKGWLDGADFALYGFDLQDMAFIQTIESYAVIRRIVLKNGRAQYEGFHGGPAAIFVIENNGVIEDLHVDRTVSLELEAAPEWDRYGVLALNVGMVAAQNRGTLERVFVAGTLKGRNAFRVGGVVGMQEGRIFDSLFSGSIDLPRGVHIGGIAGQLREGGKIIGARLDGSQIRGSLHLGGVVGSVEYGDISNVHGAGTELLGERFIGGVAGTLLKGTVHDINLKVSAYGRDQVGGVIGRMDHPRASVYDASIEFQGGGGASWAELLRGGAFGGLVGALYEGTLENSKVVGEVSTWARGDIGGAVGYLGVPGRSSPRGAEVHHVSSRARVQGAGRVGGLVGSLFGVVSDSKIESLEVSCRNSYGDGSVSSVGGVAGLFGGKLIRTRSSTVLSSVGCPEPQGLVGAQVSRVSQEDIVHSYYDHRIAGLSSEPGLGALMHSIERSPAGATSQLPRVPDTGVFRLLPRLQY